MTIAVLLCICIYYVMTIAVPLYLYKLCDEKRSTSVFVYVM